MSADQSGIKCADFSSIVSVNQSTVVQPAEPRSRDVDSPLENKIKLSSPFWEIIPIFKWPSQPPENAKSLANYVSTIV